MSPFLLSQPFHLLFSSSLLLLLLFHIPTANGQEPENQKPLIYACEGTTTYINTSSFATNLNLLLPSLSSNSTRNRGFYEDKIGVDPDTVYGQILCRGDSESDKCQDCINKASKAILGNCRTRTAAILYDTCQLRYSDTNFFGNSRNPWLFYVLSATNMKVSDLGSFKTSLANLMYDLANKTEAQPWLRNFVTGDASYAGFDNVYGLVQCLPDMSGSDCLTCLNSAIRKNMRECCVEKIGGRVIGYVCGLRFETYEFYNESKVADPAPSPPNQTTSGRGNLILILVPTIGGAVILCLIVALLRNRKTHLKKKKNVAATATVIPDSQVEITTMERFLNDMAREKPIQFSPQQLVSFTQNYANQLGSGGFGVVYKGEFPNGVQIAVKVLNGSSDKRVQEQFMAEVSTIGRTYHMNLVRLYGFCFDTSVRALVYEYMDNGSLDRFLFTKSKQIGLEKLYEIAIGTAKGIAYLHEECQQRIIHYDIKPANVLLGTNFNPKVADFGLAKLCNRDTSHVQLTGGRGTPGYAAPELYMTFPVTHKCDVYSFGMLLFEIVGRRRNHDVKRTESQEWFPRWVWEKYEGGEMEAITMDCEIEDKDREKAERMCKVALSCVQYRPEARPLMSNVVKMLEGAEIVAPQNPFQHLMGSGTGLGMWSGSSDYSTATTKANESSYKDSTRHEKI